MMIMSSHQKQTCTCIYFVVMDCVCTQRYTLNNIGSLKRTLQYYHHATPGEPYKGSPGVAW